MGGGSYTLRAKEVWGGQLYPESKGGVGGGSYTLRAKEVVWGGAVIP